SNDVSVSGFNPRTHVCGDIGHFQGNLLAPLLLSYFLAFRRGSMDQAEQQRQQLRLALKSFMRTVGKLKFQLDGVARFDRLALDDVSDGLCHGELLPSERHSLTRV